MEDLSEAIVVCEEKKAELDMIVKYQRVKGSRYYATDLDGKQCVAAASKAQEEVLKLMASLKANMQLGKRTGSSGSKSSKS